MLYRFSLLILLSLLVHENQVFGQKKVKVKLNDEAASLNANLPKDYTERTFIKGLAMYRNKIDELAGSLIILEDNDKASILGQFIKFNQQPIKNIALSDVLYSSKINSSASFNGNYMIASASASASSIVELIITDINGILIPEQSIPYLDICYAARNVDNNIKKKVYYVRTVKLSTVHSKAYQEVNANGGINGTVFSVGGKVYRSSDQFKTDYVVSVDLVSLTNLLLTRNCDEIISNNELVARQTVEKAKQEAEKAETERKIRENELNAAKAEVMALKNRICTLEEDLKVQKDTSGEIKLQADSLKKIVPEAERRVEAATNEFNKAEDKSKETSANAAQQQSKLEGSDKLIQKTDVPIINEVKKLSEEEVKKLGFEKVE